MAVDQTAKIRSLHVDFSEVSLPTPPGGWSQSQAESGGSREQAEQYERFAAQREGANFAMLVVKELHTASNTENAVNCESSQDLVIPPCDCRCGFVCGTIKLMNQL